MNKEYESLIEISNLHHNAVYDYLEKHGSDGQIRVLVESKMEWLKMVAKKFNMDIEEAI